LYLRLQIRYREADVVETRFCQVLDIGIGQPLWPDISQKLDFEPGLRLLRHQRDMLGFDPVHPHVAGERCSRDHNRLLFDKPQECKKGFCLRDVPYDDSYMINMQNHMWPQKRTEALDSVCPEDLAFYGCPASCYNRSSPPASST